MIKHYTRNGHPMKEETITVNGVVAVRSNEIKPGDIEITETQYLSLIAQIESDRQLFADNIEAAGAALILNYQSAKVKLQALGFTDDEILAII